MLKSDVDWKQRDSRSILLFSLALATLFWPKVNLFCIGLFALHSFFEKGFWHRFRGQNFTLKILLLSYFAIHTIGLFYSEDLSRGAAKINILLPLLIVPFSIGALKISEKSRTFVLNIFWMAALLAAILTLMNAALQSLEHGQFYKTVIDDGTEVRDYFFSYTQLSFFLMHPAYFSIYIGSAIFTVWHLFRKQKLALKAGWARWAVLIFLAAFLIMLQSRMQMLAFFAIVFTYVIWFVFRKRKSGFAIPALVIFLGGFFLVLKVLPESATRRLTEIKSLEYQIDAPGIHQFNGLTLRLAEWKCAWQAIENQPIIGYGTGDSKNALLESYRKNNFEVGLRRGFNAHNQYLQTWLGTGLIGVLILLAIFATLLFTTWRQKDGLLWAVSLFFFMGMITESMLERIGGNAFLALFPLFLALSQERQKAESN